ncbi:ABC transporter permease [Streptomyces sp. NBC_00988]|uniref:ABC transporter permease n=1 Tax=Streptomyces sp. NBC_00988 TaxID=2903704 RepID=UPI00386CB613|nr:ABC transporter permease [Streptomyces sp. NBC_00988]
MTSSSVEPSRPSAQEGTPQSDPGPNTATASASARTRIFGSLPQAAVPLLLVATFVGFSVLSPELFFTWTNFRIMLASQATVLLLAVAITIPLRAGDFDLSISAVMVLCAGTVGVLFRDGWPVWTCVVVSLALGGLVGALNAVFVVGIGLDGLIVTLGTFTLLNGLLTYMSDGSLISTIPSGVKDFANLQILGLPSVVWLGWIIALIAWFVFEYTPLGRYLLFIGGNRSAAALAGLRVGRIRIGAFIAASLIAALAGVLLAGSVGSVDPSSAGSYLLPPATAAFLGTTTIQLRRFNILGTLVGLYLLAFGITGLQLLGVRGWVSDVFNGAALILAIAFARCFELLKTRGHRPGLTRRRAAPAA